MAGVLLGRRIESRILQVRGQKVLLDKDLAELYGVGTHRLNEQVKRNIGRFPRDFMFRLTDTEADSLRSQIAISKPGRGGSRYNPLAFTEHGALMAANVLNSETAVKVSIEIIRAFARLREFLLSHKDLARRLDELEDRYDGQFRAVFEAIRQLMAPPEPRKKGKLGFAKET